jgi:PRTRC genetic system protein C
MALLPSNTHSVQSLFYSYSKKEIKIMSDQSSTQPRIFKTGATRIVEDEAMRGLDKEAVRNLLKTAYPEIANATIRETMAENGQQVIEFLPQPGRKG